MAKKFIERRKRGVVGWFFLILFWAVNALMAYGIFTSVYESTRAPMTNAEAAGAGIGITILLFIWAIVAFLTGIFAYMTRGRKEIVEMET